MSISRQKRKTALEYLLDGKDRLNKDMQISYNKQYGEFLFSERNVLKNLRDANNLIEKADKVMGSLDNFDKKELLNKQSVYAPYFSGQGNTVPTSPIKKHKPKDQLSEEQLQKLKNQNSNSQYLNTNHSHMTNQRLNSQVNELLQNQQVNQALLRNDTLFIDSVQQNNLHSMKMQNALRIKQLKEKDRYEQIYSKQLMNTGQGQLKSQSLDVFIPYGKERDNLGYIIDPINDFAKQQQYKKKQLNYPIERQKVSLIVPPNPEKVLVMKRGVHFFDKGQQLQSKRDDNLILTNVFKQTFGLNEEQNQLLHQLNSKQKSEYLQQKQQQYNQQINDNIHTNKIIIDGNASILSTNFDPSQVQSSIQNQSLLQPNISGDQSTLLKSARKDLTEKIQVKSELNSSNNLASNTTTFHNISQARNNSQDSILPQDTNRKLYGNNVLSGTYQPSQYYITPSASSPNKEGQSQNNRFEYSNQLGQNAEKSTTISQIAQASYIHQNSQADLPQIQIQQDSQQLLHQSQNSICANPSCKDNFQQSLLLQSTDFELNDIKGAQKFRKNLSLINIKPSLSNTTSNKNQSQQSKTLTTFDRRGNNGKKDINNEVVLEENLDASASMIANNNQSGIVNNRQVSQKFVEINMKQNQGGEISEFNLGKFIVVPDQIGEKDTTNAQEEGLLNENSLQLLPSPTKKILFNNIHFKWRMNALDQAQLIEMIRKENESKIKLPKISIYNKKKYTSDQNPAPGDYEPNYSCIEKHNRQVYFDKANLTLTSPQMEKKQSVPQLIPKNVSAFLPKNVVKNKEEGYEIMFSDLMKDVKKEVRNQKVKNKELQHPMQGLLLTAIPHQNIIELNKNMGNSMNYCKTCLNSIKYYLRADNPSFNKKQLYKSPNF